MEEDVSKHFTWASHQEANFWFANQNGDTTRLATDQELLTLLRASKIVKFIMTVDRCEHVDVAVNGTQMADNELQIQVMGNELQVDVSNEKGLLHVPSIVVAAEYEGQEWADEPELGVTAAGPPRVEEEEEEHYMEPGFDPEGDDPIGADEEWRYFKQQQQKEKRTVEKNRVQKVYKGQDPDAVPSDEATMIGEAYVAQTTYDRDNPEIKKGSTFVDKAAFKLIIKQYAITREFQTFVEHSDKVRYRARCADSNCEWKVHAKKLRGCPTFMIVSISEGHTCASTSQVKGKEATKAWIADRAKPLLQSNTRLTAKKMKDHLEHQFPLKLSYNKVWEGRQRALEGLHV
ncbi:unnamed protein product [Urochloa decumbens]|uniref:Transposase MuDR plant domain-containing protein n=1 Tax=Urochloa decumbens TaxID=240449 RepID=A0ABC9FIZ5_9POAL